MTMGRLVIKARIRELKAVVDYCNKRIARLERLLKPPAEKVNPPASSVVTSLALQDAVIQPGTTQEFIVGEY